MARERGRDRIKLSAAATAAEDDLDDDDDRLLAEMICGNDNSDGDDFGRRRRRRRWQKQYGPDSPKQISCTVHIGYKAGEKIGLICDMAL